MKSQTKSVYQVSMVVLYMVLRFGWTLYSKYWDSFSELSEDYTKDYGDKQLILVNNAQAMYDVSQRRGTVTQQGNELDASSLSGILFWKTARRYIMKAVPEANQKTAIAQAGGAHFAKANNGNMYEITQLLSAGQTYLEANAAMLIDLAKMPPTFPADYTKAKDTFDKEHIDYGSAKGDATDGTVDKITANNGLYKNIQFMFGDAQIALHDKKSIARQFSFAAVKRLVTKDMAGIHFTILDPATNKPITEAIIITDESGEEYPVNKRGVATILMKVGVHSITVDCPGFQIYTGVVKADAGIKHRVKITLQKEVVQEQITATNEPTPAQLAFNNETQLEQ